VEFIWSGSSLLGQNQRKLQEENPKILKSGSKDHIVGRGGLIVENRWSPKIEWYAKIREYFGVFTRRAYMFIGSLGKEHYLSLT